MTDTARTRTRTRSPSRRELSQADWTALKLARQRLEHPSLAARLTSVVGTPIEEGIKLLPHTWYDRLHGAAERSIQGLLSTALSTLPIEPVPSERVGERDKVMCMASGAVGGFFGLPALVVELPVTTMLMLRAIAGIARSEGEETAELDTRLACMEVFALGGRRHDDDAAETGYFGLRIALALHFSTVSRELAERGIAARGLPAAIQVTRAIAARFGVAVSDKAAMQLVPVVGAASGAMINLIFMQHFQDVARGHFVVRRLERNYGADAVREAYDAIGSVEERRGRRPGPSRR